MRNRRQKIQDFPGPVYVKEAFEVIIPDSSPFKPPLSPKHAEVPESTVRKALDDFTQSVKKMQDRYSFVKHLAEQQDRYLDSQRMILRKYEIEAEELAFSMDRVHKSLTEVDNELDRLPELSAPRKPCE